MQNSSGAANTTAAIRRPGSYIQSADVLELFEGRLARFKHPRGVIFLENLPRNTMGKVEKFTLRAKFEANSP